MTRRRRLIWQLYPSYLILVLTVLAATGWYASRAMRLFHITQVHQDLLHQTHLLAPQIAPFLRPLQQSPLDALCKQIGLRVPSRITVVLPDGTVVADSEADPASMENHGRRAEIVQALQGAVGSAQRYSDTTRKQMMYLALPMADEDMIGILRTAVSLTSVEEQLHRLQMRLAMGGIVIAVLSSLVCLVISRRLTRPMEQLRQGAARFASGDLAHRLAPPETLELASLAKSMNHMAGELEQRIQSIVRQRNETEAVLASMQEGVVALDRNERILHMNTAATLLFGNRADQMQGRSIQELVRSRELHRMVQNVLSDGQSVGKDILFHQGAERMVYTRCTPLADPRGDRIGALLVMNDVTQLRRLETMRTDFAANVSHELKTPLTAIQGFVETLVHGGVSNPQESQRFLEIVHKHVQRLGTIIDGLMQLAYLERGDESGKPHRRTVDVETLLKAAVRVCRERAVEKTIDIQITCPSPLTATLDETLMEQAIVNLLDNAIKYSPAESRVIVSAEASAQEVRIRVKDQGIGIARKHLSRLFERFYRVDKARSRRMGGTGLGLAIVKHIVLAHGGNVTVESQEGRGSEFTLHIPKMDAVQ